MKSLPFKDIQVGDKANALIAIDEQMLEYACHLSGDYSYIHISESTAKAYGFRDKVVHGFLLCGFASRLIGMELPGGTALLHGIKLVFHSPCYVNDEVKIVCRVTHKSPSTKTITLKIKVTRGDDILATGEAQVGVRE